MKAFCVAAEKDKKLLDQFLEDAEKVVEARASGRRMPRDAVRKTSIRQKKESMTRLRKPQVPCMPYRQYVAAHGNQKSKEAKKKGHMVGVVNGVKLVFMHDLVAKDATSLWKAWSRKP